MGGGRDKNKITVFSLGGAKVLRKRWKRKGSPAFSGINSRPANQIYKRGWSPRRQTLRIYFNAYALSWGPTVKMTTVFSDRSSQKQYSHSGIFLHSSQITNIMRKFRSTRGLVQPRRLSLPLASVRASVFWYRSVWIRYIRRLIFCRMEL